MAKFTASVPLNMRVFPGYEINGAAGATHRIPDAYADEFAANYGSAIPGFSWVTQDEATSVITLPIAQTDVTGLTAALAGKFDASGGIVSGATTVAGNLKVNNNLTVAGNSIVSSNETVSGTSLISGAASLGSSLTVQGPTNLSSTLGVTGAANLSSTLGVTGKLTLGDVVAMGGTAFPGSPANNDLFYRTDLDILFFRDSGVSKWLSVPLFEFTVEDRVGGAWNAGISATTTAQRRCSAPYFGSGTDIYLVSSILKFFVNGGTALGASHKWVGTLDKLDSAASATTVATHNVDSGSSSVFRESAVAINALMNGAFGPYFVLQSSWTKTGTPGNLIFGHTFTYRIVG